jgi:hypothetical protein
MEYRIGRDKLLDRLRLWNGYLRRRVRLVACGGTAMTLLGFKESTKDIDLMVPEPKEYEYLIRTLTSIGYSRTTENGWRTEDIFIFDIYRGNCVHTTELLDSPLQKGNHTVVQNLSRIQLSVLNDYDLIITKLFRGTAVDFEDCTALAKGRQGMLDLHKLKERFRETASYALGEGRINKNLDIFLERLKEG